MPRPANQMRELARLGAEIRLRELKQEVAALLEHFPDLKKPAIGALVRETPSSARPSRTASGAPVRRRKLSAEARERIRQAQFKRWAAVRARKKR